MPLDESQIWTPTPGSEYLVDIRASLDAAFGEPLDYERTLDEAYTVAMADGISRNDQGMALAVSTILLGSAPPQAVVAWARRYGLTPKAETTAQVLVDVVGSGTVSGSARVFDDQSQEWEIVSAYTDDHKTEILPDANDDYTVDSDSSFLLQAKTSGALDSGSNTYTFQPTISGVTLSYDQLVIAGKDAETTSELRQRIISADAEPAGSMAGLRAALLDVTGVTSVSISRPSAGTLQVGVVFAGALTDRTEFAEQLYRFAPATAVLTGSESVTVTGVDGRDVTVYYEIETPQTVTVIAELISDDTVSDLDVTNAATVAINAVASALDAGETLRILALQGAIASVEGVTGITTLTLDGGTSDITPDTSTTTLALSLTVSITP